MNESASSTASAPAGYATREPTHAPPWHELVVWDVFFNALTTGIFSVAAVGELARPAAFAPVGVWAYPLALVLLLVDLTLLVLDLGDKLKFHHMLRVFKPSSPMSLGTWCLTLYSLPLTALVALDALVLVGLLRADEPALGWVRAALLVAGIPFAFGSMAYKGVLFSTSAQPGWKDARWLGAYHVASAFALGAATLLALAALTDQASAARMLRPAVTILIVAQVVPLSLLLIELRPTLGRAYRTAHLRAATVGWIGFGIVIPRLLLRLDGAIPAVVAAVAVLAAGWIIRQLVITLPHRLAHPRSGTAR